MNKTGKKQQKRSLELSRPHVNLFRDRIYSDVFQDGLVGLTADEVQSLFSLEARKACKETKVLKTIKRMDKSVNSMRDIVNVVMKESSDDEISGTIVLRSWDDGKNYVGTFVAFDFTCREAQDEPATTTIKRWNDHCPRR